MYDLIVVGGGASGTMCAITASARGLKTLILDKNPTPAKKLMVTGNGKCNLTNTNMSSKFYNVKIDKYLSRFGEKDTIDFFAKMGLVTYADNMGRVYPYSNSARSVVDIIKENLNKNNVDYIGEQVVTKIKKVSNNWQVLTENKEFLTKNLVLACGQTNIEFNETISPLYPSLCALRVNESTKRLSGIRLSDVVVSAKCCNKTMVDRGEVLFKDDGLSGIVVFNLSCLFARSKSYTGTITIDLMPEYSNVEVKQLISSRISSFGQNCFSGLFVDEVAKLICRKAGITKITQSSVESLAHVIKNLKFDVVGYYNNNQVYSGGVCLSSLDNNLQSKTQKGLYVIGELCDVDGECGGYNLQWAWTSGHIVGESI